MCNSGKWKVPAEDVNILEKFYLFSSAKLSKKNSTRASFFASINSMFNKLSAFYIKQAFGFVCPCEFSFYQEVG